jgi:hypothetical protein
VNHKRQCKSSPKKKNEMKPTLAEFFFESIVCKTSSFQRKLQKLETKIESEVVKANCVKLTVKVNISSWCQ